MVVVGVDAPLSPPPAMAVALLPLLLRAANAVSYNGRRVVGLTVVELELVVVLGRVGGDGTSGVVVVAEISMDTSERCSDPPPVVDVPNAVVSVRRALRTWCRGFSVGCE